MKVWVKGILLLCLLVFLPVVAQAATAARKNFTLVIDAGHGGGDNGAVGRISKEKNLTLKFALAFGQLVEQNCPDVRVIYTRKTDKFVELYRRAEIANEAKADLFISFHINALPRGRVARGFQTYTLGRSKRTGMKNGVDENLEVAKRENSVIFLEKDYQQTYQGFDPNSDESIIMFEFMQDKNMENSVELAKYMQKYVCQATGRQNMGAQQDNLAVLRLTSMPACLIELGFISTSDEEQYMNTPRATEQYARGVFNAFLAYRKRHGGNITIPYMMEESKPAKKSKRRKASKPDPVVEADPLPMTEQPVAAELSQSVEPAVVEPTVVEPVPTPQPKPETVVVAEPQPKPEPVAKPVVASKPVFKVQILVSSTRLRSTDAQFKGLRGVASYQEGGMFKYTVGSSESYEEIRQLRKSILDKFPQAFIIAFKDGVRVDANSVRKK